MRNILINSMVKGRMYIPLSKPTLTKDMIEAAIYALQNEKLVFGESVFKFEEEFARYIGVKHAVSTNSGTSALILAFYAINITSKDFVVSPSATFISTISSAMLLGARPMFAEINLNNYTIEPEYVKKLICKNSKESIKVIIPVHLYGYPAEMDQVMEIAQEKNLYVIEDAAQAHGAKFKGKKVGSIGHIGIFSFYSIKNMTVGGDGGILVTNDEEIATIAKKLRDCGRRGKYSYDMLGYVFRLNTINAAIGRVQLKYLDKWNERRREIAALYDKLLSDLDEVKTPPKPSFTKEPVYHLYVIRLKNEIIRDSLGAWLESQGIQTLVHYPVPLHLQPIMKKLYNFKKGMLPKTELWARTVLSIPMFPELKDDQVHFISEKIHEFFEKKLYEEKKWVKRGRKWIQKLV